MTTGVSYKMKMANYRMLIFMTGYHRKFINEF